MAAVPRVAWRLSFAPTVQRLRCHRSTKALSCKRSARVSSLMHAVPVSGTLRGIAGTAILFLLCITMAATAPLKARMTRETVTIVTGSGEKRIDTEIAATANEKAVGLMFRTTLPDTEGMLFAYDQPLEITMWMKNTYIPLDMVFIKPDGIVHRIEIRTEPLSENIIASQGQVIAVLELAGGAAERLGIKPGDKVKHRFFK
jgi:uncharacterized membrane protein (UPF0127 family)